MELETKVFHLNLNNVSGILILERYDHPGHVRKIVVLPFKDLLRVFSKC